MHHKCITSASSFILANHVLSRKGGAQSSEQISEHQIVPVARSLYEGLTVTRGQGLEGGAEQPACRFMQHAKTSEPGNVLSGMSVERRRARGSRSIRELASRWS